MKNKDNGIISKMGIASNPLGAAKSVAVTSTQLSFNFFLTS